jgi:hypothetical protein
MESIKLVAFRGQFCHFKVLCFSFGQKYPKNATNLILSISNEMERILLHLEGYFIPIEILRAKLQMAGNLGGHFIFFQKKKKKKLTFH